MKDYTTDVKDNNFGTSLIGYLKHTTYEHLSSVFGPPTYTWEKDDGGDNKVKISWDLEIDDMDIRIYEWKNYELSVEGVKKFITRWHVGGHYKESKEALAAVRQTIDECLQAQAREDV